MLQSCNLVTYVIGLSFDLKFKLTQITKINRQNCFSILQCSRGLADMQRETFYATPILHPTVRPSCFRPTVGHPPQGTMLVCLFVKYTNMHVQKMQCEEKNANTKIQVYNNLKYKNINIIKIHFFSAALCWDLNIPSITPIQRRLAGKYRRHI